MVVMMPVPSKARVSAARSVYTLVSQPRPLLPQCNILVLRRAPNRGNPDQPNAISLCNTRGRYLGVCAGFLGSTWRGDQGLSYEVLWVFRH